MSKSFKSFKIKVEASDKLANSLIAKHVKEKLGGYAVATSPLEFLQMRNINDGLSYVIFSHVPSRGYVMRWIKERQFERSNYHEFSLYELLQYHGDEVEVKTEAPKEPQFKLVEEFKVKVSFNTRGMSHIGGKEIAAMRNTTNLFDQETYTSYKKAQDEAFKYLVDNVKGIPWSFTIKRRYRSEQV